MVALRRVAMKRDEMFAIAQRELVHIPKGEYPQGVLRSVYWTMRLNSLGRKRELPNSPRLLVERAVADVLHLEPSANLEYDHNFFGGQL
jgi:hypothetical protein